MVQDIDTKTKINILSCKLVDIKDDNDEQDDNDDTTDEGVGNLQMKVSIDEVAANKFRVIYAHPEAFLSLREDRKSLHIKALQHHVCGICIEEAHMIKGMVSY